MELTKEKVKETIGNIEKEIKEIKKYIKESNKKLKVGQVVNYCGYEWYIIATRGAEIDLFMKDILSEEKIKQYFKNEDMLDEDYDVRFSDNDNNNWKDSYIRHVLNNDFINEFDKENLVKKEKDYIRLITIEEIGRLSQDITKSSRYGYCTMPPYSDNSYIVLYVDSAGRVGYNSATDSFGVRPVITVKAEALKEEGKVK